MRSQKEIIQTTLKNRQELYKIFLEKIVSYTENGKYDFNNLNDTLTSYFELIIDEINDFDILTKNKVNFSICKALKNVASNLELIKKSIDSNQIINEIDSFLKENDFESGAIVIEFDNYDFPLPYIKGYGKFNYKALRGEEYIESYGEEKGWFKSDIDWTFMFESLKEIDWLDQDLGLSEVYYGFIELIKSHIFLFYSNLFYNNNSSRFKVDETKSMFIYITERDIEPYSIFIN